MILPLTKRYWVDLINGWKPRYCLLKVRRKRYSNIPVQIQRKFTYLPDYMRPYEHIREHSWGQQHSTKSEILLKETANESSECSHLGRYWSTWLWFHCSKFWLVQCLVPLVSPSTTTMILIFETKKIVHQWGVALLANYRMFSHDDLSTCPLVPGFMISINLSFYPHGHPGIELSNEVFISLFLLNWDSERLPILSMSTNYQIRETSTQTWSSDFQHPSIYHTASWVCIHLPCYTINTLKEGFPYPTFCLSSASTAAT